ncbi:hypothetical protein BV25DRAFT_1834639 [Artomyces pyxidatus]|uniref:Uncharacterized protein n=1 Tax=Artomyces pyxidatus TaxID=48021 RepID=A0ACB8TGH8_9AGAM|nr:hypothetical protein BV25DRAFT_1834639 [Artomyces pyxidatus]
MRIWKKDGDLSRLLERRPALTWTEVLSGVFALERAGRVNRKLRAGMWHEEMHSEEASLISGICEPLYMNDRTTTDVVTVIGSALKTTWEKSYRLALTLRQRGKDEGAFVTLTAIVDECVTVDVWDRKAWSAYKAGWKEWKCSRKAELCTLELYEIKVSRKKHTKKEITECGIEGKKVTGVEKKNNVRGTDVAVGKDTLRASVARGGGAAISQKSHQLGLPAIEGCRGSRESAPLIERGGKTHGEGSAGWAAGTGAVSRSPVDRRIRSYTERGSTLSSMEKPLSALFEVYFERRLTKGEKGEGEKEEVGGMETPSSAFEDFRLALRHVRGPRDIRLAFRWHGRVYTSRGRGKDNGKNLD